MTSSRILSIVAIACLGLSGCATSTTSPADTNDATTVPTTGGGDSSDTSTTSPRATAASNSSDSDAAADTTDAKGDQDATFGWVDHVGGTQAGILEVPLDYDDPTAGTIELFMVRHPATDQANKIGTLLVNPGGPGVGGSILGEVAGWFFKPELTSRFDIIGWDPRGTGESEPAIDCVDNLDRYHALDNTPNTDEARQLLFDRSKEFVQACLTKNARIVDRVGTNNSARDMDAIRRALGEDKISYLGISYGSELGATWATLFPNTVRAAVLDGAADPTASALEWGTQQSIGFEQSIKTFLDDCSNNPKCAFHHDGNADDAFDKLFEQLDAKPLTVSPDRPPVNRDVAMTGVVAALYSSDSWPTLAQALARAEAGDGSGLLGLYDEYLRRNDDGTFSNLLEAFTVISCADNDHRVTTDEMEQWLEKMNTLAPRMSPKGGVPLSQCTGFPPAADPRVKVTGKGAGPIVVVGATGDPATPLASTKVMADELEDGRLVVLAADSHGGYGESACVRDIIHRYLVDLEAPENGVECARGS